jgi:hypothetical protein
MEMLKTNSEGGDREVTEVPQQVSVEAQIEYGRAASEDGFITVLGSALGEPDPERPVAATLQSLAFNGVVIRQGLLPQSP